MRNVPFEDSLVGLGDVVDEVLGKFVVLGALLGALASSKDLAEGNSDGTPPGPLVERLVSVAVGYSVGSRDVGTPPVPLVGMLVSGVVGYSVGSRDVGTPPGLVVGRLASVALEYSVGI